MELHAGKMAGVQNDLAAFPLVPGKLLGLLPAVCRHLHFHLQRFPDGNNIEALILFQIFFRVDIIK